MSVQTIGIQEEVRGIPVHVYDFTGKALYGFEPGFYYSIPLGADGNYVPPEKEVFLSGPHETQELALKAAHDWILDALADHRQLDPLEALLSEDEAA